MDLFSIASLIIVMSAVFGYINVRFLKLPNTIGLMVIAIGFTMLLFASALVTERPLEIAEELIARVDFEHVLLDVMLGFLLFAGALHTNFDQLSEQRWPILFFSTAGVLISTFVTAGGMYFGLRLIGLEVPFMHCLLFGALISPTDPIAVLGILKQANVAKKLEIKIVGESLFNDGIGVVVFLTIMSIVSSTPSDKLDADEVGASQPTISQFAATAELAGASADVAVPLPHEAANSDSHAAGHGAATVLGVVILFVQEVLGGILFGLLIGFISYRLMKTIDNYEVEVIITLACAMGGYSAAHWLGLSAPLAIVVAGLFVGNDRMRGASMSKVTEQYVDHFWELLDMLLNAALFVMIGLEVLVLTIRPEYILASLIAIVVVLFARACAVAGPVQLFGKSLDFVPHTATIMTWGGLRGGISIALALSLAPDMNRNLFLTVTYGVVVFSIIVQGLTVGRLAQRLIGHSRDEELKPDA